MGFETLFSKVIALLSLCMFGGSCGAYLGRKITSVAALILLGILFLAGAIGLYPAAQAGAGVAIWYLMVWTFVSGLFIGPTIQCYSEEIGWRTVALAFLGTAGVMVICGSIGLLSGISFSGLGAILGIALFGLVAAGIVRLFVAWSDGASIIYSVFGMLIFSGYFLYDFWRLGASASTENTWAKATLLSAQLYLDFLNFFLHLLMFIAKNKPHK
jgi:modulator of FtsH protease